MIVLVSIITVFTSVIIASAIQYFIYKREHAVVKINREYRYQLARLEIENAVLKKKLEESTWTADECISAAKRLTDEFNSTYSNTRIDFDEDDLSFSIKDTSDSTSEMPCE